MRPSFFRFVAALTFAGCASSVGNRATSEIESTPSSASEAPSGSPAPARATRAIRNTAYRFDLDIPAGWEAVPDDQLLQLHIDAVAAIRSTTAPAIVAVEVTPVWSGDESEQVVVEWARMLNVRELRPGARSVENFAGNDAMAFSGECSLGGVAMKVDARLFARGQHFFGVHLIQTADGGVDVERALANFHPTEGEQTRDDIDVRLARDSGAGWRVEDRHLYDVVRGLVVEIPDGWSYLDRWSTRALTGEDNFGLAAERTSSLVAFNGVAVDAADLPALDRMTAATFEARVDESHRAAAPETLQVGGRPYTLQTGTHEGVEFRLGRVCLDPVCFVMQTRRLATDTDDLTPLFERVNTWFRAMTPEERTTWRTRVPTTAQTHIVADMGTFLGGRFVDNVHGARLTLPERITWNVSPTNTGFTAFAADAPFAVRFDLVEQETPNAAEAHRAALEGFNGASSSRPVTRRRGRATIIESTVRVTEAGGVALVATGVRGNITARLIITGLAHGMDANMTAVRAIAASFDLANGPIDPIRSVRTRRYDDHAGYSFELPASWHHEAGAHSLPDQFSDRWFDGDHEILIRTHGPTRGPDSTRGPGAMTRWLTWSDPSAPTPDHWESTTLNGVPASTVAWTSSNGVAMRAWHLVADRTGFMLVTRDNPDDVARAQTFRVENTRP